MSKSDVVWVEVSVGKDKNVVHTFQLQRDQRESSRTSLFEQLKQSYRHYEPSANEISLCFAYRDEEDDLVTIVDTSDFEEALRVSSNLNKQSLQLILLPTASNKERKESELEASSISPSSDHNNGVGRLDSSLTASEISSDGQVGSLSLSESTLESGSIASEFQFLLKASLAPKGAREQRPLRVALRSFLMNSLYFAAQDHAEVDVLSQQLQDGSVFQETEAAFLRDLERLRQKAGLQTDHSDADAPTKQKTASEPPSSEVTCRVGLKNTHEQRETTEHKREPGPGQSPDRHDTRKYTEPDTAAQASALETISRLGWKDHKLNLFLLQKHNGNVTTVVNWLMQHYPLPTS